MTAAEHTRVGLALGYPPCCVRQWVEEVEAHGPAPWALEECAGFKRGGVYLGYRAGVPTVFRERDGHAFDAPGEEIVYVPCDVCAGPHTPGWEPWAREDTEALQSYVAKVAA